MPGVRGTGPGPSLYMDCRGEQAAPNWPWMMLPKMDQVQKPTLLGEKCLDCQKIVLVKVMMHRCVLRIRWATALESAGLDEDGHCIQFEIVALMRPTPDRLARICL